MQHGFVPNGGERLESHPDYQAWKKARMEAIKAEYAPLLAQARGWQRLRLKWRMWRVPRQLGSSEATLWGAEVVSGGWRNPAVPERR